MIVGIVAGLCMCGLLVGAFTGSLWLLLGFAAAGFLIAATIEIVAARPISHYKYSQYPPYGY